MVKKRFTFLVTGTIVVFQIFFLSFCSCSNSPVSTEDRIVHPTGEFSIKNYLFYKTDSTVTLLTKTCKCVKDTMIKHLDTTEYRYILKKDSLQLIYIQDSIINFSVHLLFSRLSGKDLNGDWLFQSSWYSIKGSCSRTDSLIVMLSYNGYSGKDISWMSIEQNNLTFYTNPGTEDFTRESHLTFLAQSYDEKFNIVFDSLSPLSYRLLGNNTNDTLNVQSVTTDTTIVYTTNDSVSFPDYAFKNNGSICYNIMFPEWYKEFLNQNSRLLNLDFSHLFLEKIRNDTTLDKYYSISYDSISPYSLQLIGNSSKDTVTINKTFKMDVIFTSNNPFYYTYITNDYNPNPEGKYPPWLKTTSGNFLAENIKKELSESH